jgi:pyridoxine 5-phosphate synthase
MPLLGVNIDHVATLRQARRGSEPDVLAAAQLAVDAGADSIVCHLREDRRHIQDADVFAIRKHLATHLTLEMAVDPELMEIALKLKPDHVMFVPERREEITTEGGLNIRKHFDYLKDVTHILRASGVVTSIFIDPEIPALDLAQEVGAEIGELHTGPYANSWGDESREDHWQRIKDVAVSAKQRKFTVHAGHGLNYSNVSAIAAIPELDELNIGHSIVSRAIFVGMERAVLEMKALVSEGDNDS